jgi:hypothetical protein
VALRVVDPLLRAYAGAAGVYATLTAAAAAAGAGDTVQVRGDTVGYGETNVYIHAAASVWEGYAGDPLPRVDGLAAGTSILRCHGAGMTVRRLLLTNAGASAGVACVRLNSSNQIVSDLTVEVTGSGGIYSAATNPTIQRCTIDRAARRAVDLQSASGGLVENVAILGGAVCLSLGAGMTARHVTVAGTAATLRGVEILTAALLTNSLVIGCKAVGVSWAGVYLSNAGALVKYTSAWDNATNFLVVAGTKDASCDELEPLFIDRGAKNYRLVAPPNAAVDTGEATACADDLDGNPRPQGAAPDRGAYELQGTAPYVVGASASGYTSVAVVFDQDVTGVELEDDTAWAISPLGAGAAVAITAAAYDVPTRTVALTTSAHTPAEDYRVTAPDLIESLVGVAIDPAGKTADYLTDGNTWAVTIDGPRTITATFQFDPGVDVSAPAGWGVAVADGVSDVARLASGAQVGAVVTLTTDFDLTPGGIYGVTCPWLAAGVAEASATLLAACTHWGPTPPVVGPLQALIAATANELARQGGDPRTRLSVSLAPGATEAVVESTFGLPEAGTVRVGSEEIPYASRDGFRLFGFVRATVPAGQVTHPAGTEVVGVLSGHSSRERLATERIITLCPADALDALARDLGFPRPFSDMTAENLRAYLRARLYLASGPWTAVLRVLRPALAWTSVGNTNGAVRIAGADVWLDVPSTSLGGGVTVLHDRWIDVDGRLCRIVTADTTTTPGTTSLLLESRAGYFWQAADHVTDGQTDVAWELLAFRLRLDPNAARAAKPRGGLLVVYLYATQSAGSTFLITSGLALPQGRLERGKLSASSASIGDGQSFYLAAPYARTVREILEDVIPAGIEVKVVSLAQPSP